MSPSGWRVSGMARSIHGSTGSALAGWVTSDRRRRVRIERVDGTPVAESPLKDALARAGFREDLRGYSLRA